ncbi:hypothetical protein PALB_4030 [Pseudoalteromonas luteoviolacea B = ATCC 29581]|nr:hypothetical protein PALB_4030 [Pseudoalteromonas luteoviolacea B = ATCC 29581]
MKHDAVTSAMQTTIWQNEAERLAFAELANVFYAREIKHLSDLTDLARMQRLLKSLPVYVERAARHIIQGDIPIPLDTQNACWLSPVRKQPLIESQKNTEFFARYGTLGLVVPILYKDAVYCQLFMDSLDQVRENSVHCNQYGWFNFDGQHCENEHLSLLKPTKAIMTAACCGHQWKLGKPFAPRLLTLRDMLLASSINWGDVKKTKRQARPFST